MTPSVLCLPDDFPFDYDADETPYYCVVCGHACLRMGDYVFHDPVPHPPIFFALDEDANPQ